MIYIMGDIHGRLDRFQEVMRQINLRKEDHLYVLGDVIDRYPDGLRILRNLLKRSNVTVLLGNHEHMMLEALTKDHPNNKYMERWYNNGGAVTHRAWKHCIPIQSDQHRLRRYRCCQCFRQHRNRAVQKLEG